MLQALGLPLPDPVPDALTQDEFMARFAAPGGAVRAVPVHKRRVRYTIGGCTAELSEVTAAGRTTRTLAVESEDAAAVIAAVRGLGLGDWVNTSYPRGLAALVDGTAERYAVIDAGTNSIKFIVAERAAGGGWRTLVDRAEITRLGEGLAAGGAIIDSARDRAVAAIADMADEARRHGVRAIAAVGTAGLRIASNGAQVVDADRGTQRRGDRDHLGRRGGPAGLRRRPRRARAEPGLAGDLRHRRRQLAVHLRPWRRRSTSASASMSARCATPSAIGSTARCRTQTLREALAAIASDLSRLDGRAPPDALAAMGGAVTNLAAVRHGLASYDPDVVQGTVLDRAEIDRQIELYRTRDADARRRIVGLQPKRAEVILAGACIVRTVMDKLGKPQLTVSDRGLRHGVLAERFGNP